MNKVKPCSLLKAAEPVLELSKGFAKSVKLDPDDQTGAPLQRGWRRTNCRTRSDGDGVTVGEPRGGVDKAGGLCAGFGWHC